MDHPTDHIFRFFKMNLFLRQPSKKIKAGKRRISDRAFRVLSAVLFCLLLWAVDFGLKKIVTGYFQGTILYGCIFSFMLLRGNRVKKPAERAGGKKLFPESKTEMDEKGPVHRTSIGIEQSLKFRQQLKDHFETTNAFRKQGYTIRDLSNETGIPVYLISCFINQEYGMNFNEWVNAYRVEYLAKMFKTTADWESYTLEAVGKIAGFNSRTAFIAAIKKHTGMTPSAFFGRRECERAELPIFISGQRMADVA